MLPISSSALEVSADSSGHWPSSPGTDGFAGIWGHLRSESADLELASFTRALGTVPEDIPEGKSSFAPTTKGNRLATKGDEQRPSPEAAVPRSSDDGHSEAYPGVHRGAEIPVANLRDSRLKEFGVRLESPSHQRSAPVETGRQPLRNGRMLDSSGRFASVDSGLATHKGSVPGKNRPNSVSGQFADASQLAGVRQGNPLTLGAGFTVGPCQRSSENIELSETQSPDSQISTANRLERSQSALLEIPFRTIDSPEQPPTIPGMSIQSSLLLRSGISVGDSERSEVIGAGPHIPIAGISPPNLASISVTSADPYTPVAAGVEADMWQDRSEFRSGFPGGRFNPEGASFVQSHTEQISFADTIVASDSAKSAAGGTAIVSQSEADPKLPVPNHDAFVPPESLDGLPNNPTHLRAIPAEPHIPERTNSGSWIPNPSGDIPSLSTENRAGHSIQPSSVASSVHSDQTPVGELGSSSRRKQTDGLPGRSQWVATSSNTVAQDVAGPPNSESSGAVSGFNPSRVPGHSVRGSESSTGRLASPDTSNPFLVMDRVQLAGVSVGRSPVTQSLSVGYHDPALGYVELHAGVKAGGVHAALTTSTDGARASLGAQVGALNDWMNEHHMPLASIGVVAREASAITSLGAAQSLTMDSASGSGVHSGSGSEAGRQLPGEQSGQQSGQHPGAEPNDCGNSATGAGLAAIAPSEAGAPGVATSARLVARAEPGNGSNISVLA